MNVIKLYVFVIILFGFSTTLQAAWQWTTCQNVIGISDYRAHDSTIMVTLPLELSGCPSNATGTSYIRFKDGTAGITNDIQKSVIAIGSSAHVSGNKVMIYYEDTGGWCNGRIISLGGYAGQCQ